MTRTTAPGGTLGRDRELRLRERIDQLLDERERLRERVRLLENQRNRQRERAEMWKRRAERQEGNYARILQERRSRTKLPSSAGGFAPRQVGTPTQNKPAGRTIPSSSIATLLAGSSLLIEERNE